MAEQFNVMQSLFGFTPQAVQQQEMQAAERQAMQLASAGGAAAPSLFYGLRAAGRFGAAPVFGPSQQAQQAGALQSIVQQAQQSGADLATPDGMNQLANELQRNPQFAGIGIALRQEADRMAQQRQLTESEIFRRTAQGMKALQEKPEPTVKTPSDFAEVASELGFGVKASLADYTAEESRQVNAELQKRKLQRAEATAPKPSPTEKATLPGKAKLLADVETGALQAAKTNQTADSIDRVLTTAFTGFGADAKLRASQVAEAFGVRVTGTSETEQLKQLLAQLAQGQARTLPGALSEKELAFLREAIGTPGFTVQTLRNVVNRLRKDALTSEIENQEVQNFVSGGGDLNRYNFVSARKKAQDDAAKQIEDRTAKLRRLEELRRKQQGQ